MPDEQQVTPDEPISPDVFVFTHFEVGGKTGDFPGEFQNWYEAYDLNRQVAVPGAQTDVYYNESNGVAATVTGIGKSLCTTTVSSILASPQFDFDETFFLSAGISGTPPDVGTTGCVFVSDYVVDWDLAHRWAQEDSANASYNRSKGQGKGAGTAATDDYAAEPLPYRPFDYSYEVAPANVERALSIAQGVSLADSEQAQMYRQNYPDKAARRSPFVDIGTTVTGDEYWHGETFSEQSQYFCDLYDAGTYATTEQEDFGTATALRRHGHFDRYLSLRSVSNFDQPYPGQTVRESLFEADSGGYLPSITNVFRVGSAIADDIRSIPSAWGV
jgi:purine nucleoside permease